MPKRHKSGARRSRRGRARGGRMLPSGVKSDVKMPMPMYIPASRTHTMMFSNVLVASTDGSGVFGAYIPFDPSVTLSARFGSAALFTEYSAYTNFWADIKLLRFEAQLVRTFTDDVKGDIAGPLAIASTLSPVASTPVSYQGVADNGDSQLWNVVQDYSGVNKYHSVRVPQLAWAVVATPNPGSSSGISAGCPGSILFFGNNLPVTTTIMFVKVRGLYKFRTRV